MPLPLGPEQAEDLRRLDGKAQVVERQAVAIVMGEAVELNGHLLRHLPAGIFAAGCWLSVAMAYLLPVAFSIITVSSSGK